MFLGIGRPSCEVILYVIKGTVFHLIFEKKKGETFFFAGDVP